MKNIDIINRKAYFNYTVLDKLECGIELRGNEVKSIRSGMCSIKEAWCDVQNNELYIKNMHITKYDTSNSFDVDETRPRKLLAHKKEIISFNSRTNEKGVALVPLKIYAKGNRIKVLVGLCRGKKLYDKRRDIKERDLNRELRRENKYNIK